MNTPRERWPQHRHDPWKRLVAAGIALATAALAAAAGDLLKPAHWIFGGW